jgi:hypothetical protein
MKNDIYEILKFRLDEESYTYEFEIIPVPPYEIIENNLSLEPYEYFGEINNILGFRTKQVILYFNADVLMKVEIKFSDNITLELKEILENLNVSIPSIMFLKLYYLDAENETVILYQKNILNLLL